MTAGLTYNVMQVFHFSESKEKDEQEAEDDKVNTSTQDSQERSDAVHFTSSNKKTS